MVDEITLSRFKSGLEKIINNPQSGFIDLDPKDYGAGVNYYTSQFARENNISEQDLNVLDNSAQETFKQFKQANNMPRTVLSGEQFIQAFGGLPSIPETGKIEDKIAAIDKWKEAGVENYAKYNPAEAEDGKFQAEAIANSYIRDEVAKDNKTSWLGDKTYRAIEGFVRMGISFADVEWADRFFAENLPEDPNSDNNIDSMLASGFGEISSQAITSLISAATLGPQSIPYTLGALYSARAMKEGYDEEIKRSGDSVKALDVAVASVPGALLETTADTLLFGASASIKKTVGAAMRSATTEEAKRQILKELLPSRGAEILKNGLSEATVGAIGADFATGYGRYLASGDEKYIPTTEELLKGGLVEGILGAGYTSLFGRGQIDAQTKELAEGVSEIQGETFVIQNKEKTNAIFEALKKKDFDTALRIANEKPQAAQQTREEKIKAAKELESGGEVKTDATVPQVNNIPSRPLKPSHISGLEKLAKVYEEEGNTERAQAIRDTIAAVRGGTYTPDNKFSLGLDLTQDGYSPIQTFGDENVTDILTTDAGEVEVSGQVAYITGIDPSDLNFAKTARNGVGIVTDSKDGEVVFNNNGKLTRDKGVNFKIHQTPQVGSFAIKINNKSFNLDSGLYIVDDFEIVSGKIKSHKSVEVQRNIEQLSASDKLKAIPTIKETISDLEGSQFGAGGLSAMQNKVDDAMDALKAHVEQNPDDSDAAAEIGEYLVNLLESRYQDLANLAEGARRKQQPTLALPWSQVATPPAPAATTPNFGDRVSYEGYEGTLRRGEIGLELETDDGKFVDIPRGDVANISFISRPAPQQPVVEQQEQQEPQGVRYPADFVTNREGQPVLREQAGLLEGYTPSDIATITTPSAPPQLTAEQAFAGAEQDLDVIEAIDRVQRGLITPQEGGVMVMPAAIQQAISNINERITRLQNSPAENKQEFIAALEDMRAFLELEMEQVQGAKNSGYEVNEDGLYRTSGGVKTKMLNTSTRKKKPLTKPKNAQQKQEVQKGMRVRNVPPQGNQPVNDAGVNVNETSPEQNAGGRKNELPVLNQEDLKNNPADVVEIVSNDGLPVETTVSQERPVLTPEAQALTDFISYQQEKLAGITDQKEIARINNLISQKQAQLALLANTNTNTLPDAINALKEEAAQIQESKASQVSNVERQPTDEQAEEQIKKGAKEQESEGKKKVGIKPGDIIPDDVSINRSPTYALNKTWSVSAKGKNYLAINDKKKGWTLLHQTNPEQGMVLGKTRAESQTTLANLVNNNPNTLVEFEYVATPEETTFEEKVASIHVTTDSPLETIKDAERVTLIAQDILNTPVYTEQLQSAVNKAKKDHLARNMGSRSYTDFFNKFQRLFGGYGISPNEFISYVVGAQELKMQDARSKAKEGFLSAFKKYISEQGLSEKFWSDEKIDKAADYYVGGLERTDEFLAIFKAPALDRIDKFSQEFDTSLAEKVEADRNVRISAKDYEALRQKEDSDVEEGIRKVRYSLSSNNTINQLDKEYLELAKNPEKNKKRLQQLVDKAAALAGYKGPWYHGTDKTFTVFKRSITGNYGPGIYLTNDETFAKNWTNSGKVLKLYTKVEGEPLKTNQFAGVDFRPLPKDTKRPYGFTSKKLPNGVIWQKVWNPEQIKSADPVTYDDNGNIIPLSQRFQPESPDIRFSLASDILFEPISIQQATDFINSNNLPVQVVETKETTSNGNDWNGRTIFTNKGPIIQVNVANIGSVEELRNIINEEIAHVIYNNPELAALLNPIANTTQINQALAKLGYPQDKLQEESVVKRTADLVDLYNAKGTFDKIISAIKVWLKENLGISLSENDLKYVVYRAINRATKDARFNNPSILGVRNQEERFSYAGEKAQMQQFMRDSLESAKAMAATGKTSEEIRAATGWFPGIGSDTKLRFEVPDNDVKVNKDKFGNLKINDDFLISLGIYEDGISLGDLLENNPEIFNIYPDLRDVLVYRTRYDGSSHYDPYKNAIILSSDSSGTLLHEVQHFIQIKEGFATGGNSSAKFLVESMPVDKFISYFNVENMKNGNNFISYLDKLRKLKEYDKLSDKEKKAVNSGDFGKGWDLIKGKNLTKKLKDKYGIDGTLSIYEIHSMGGIDSYFEYLSQNISDLHEDLKKQAIEKLDRAPSSKYALYRSIAGEIEARDVESRINLTDEQRAAIAPYSSEDTTNAIIRFGDGVNESRKQEQKSPLDTAFEEDNILSSVLGKTSEEQVSLLRILNKARKLKLEQKLIVDEPSVWRAIKNVNARFLSESDIKNFISLVDNFINTRRKVKEPMQGIRRSTGELLAELEQFTQRADQAHFDSLQDEHEFLRDKSFGDYDNDIGLVLEKVRDWRKANENDSIFPSGSNEAMDNYIERIQELQSLFAEEPDFVKNRFEESLPEIEISSNNDIVGKYKNKIEEEFRDLINANRKFYKSYLQFLTTDPTNLSFKQVRDMYYGLQSFFSDGYILNASNFISQETQTLLDTFDTNQARNPFSGKATDGITFNSGQLSNNLRRMGSYVYEWMNKFISPFREGINQAERMYQTVMQPALRDALKKAHKIDGVMEYSPVQQNQAGIYGYARQYKMGEGITQGLLETKRWLESSVSKYINSYNKNKARSGKEQMDFIQSIYNGLNENTKDEDALSIIEDNAAKLLPEGLRGFVNDVAALYDSIKPLSKYTSEVVYGRKFEEWVNYIPAFAMHNQNGGIVDFPINANEVDLSMRGVIDDASYMKTGGGSTKQRKRYLGEGRVLVFNINHLADNRMRLALMDYFTATARRELKEAMNSDKFKEIMDDKDLQKGRVNHLNKTIQVMWNNVIQSASFVSPFQAGLNVATSWWARGKLSSIYQLPGQFTSNTIPFFVVNAMNPQKIKYFFQSVNILIKYKFGKIDDPRLNSTIERILFSIKQRQQEAFMDRSVSLDLNSSQMKELFLKTGMGQYLTGGAKKVNEFLDKALYAQFKYSDILSGAPIMMAEYMDREVKAGRIADNGVEDAWNSLTYNPESYNAALDETERFIGVGAASRRGVWLNNKNGWMMVVRNMISAFSSHRVNNANNFVNELRTVLMTNSNEERFKSLQYMTGIIAQSAMFTYVKYMVVMGFYNLLSDKMDVEEDEEELEKLLTQMAANNVSKQDQDLVRAEISMRKKIRAELDNVKRRNSDEKLLAINFGKDVISNAFIIPAVSETPLNTVLHILYDKGEQEAFKLAKDGITDDLKKKLELAKKMKDYSGQAKLELEIARIGAQEALLLSPPRMSSIPFEGSYGGFFNDLARIAGRFSGKAAEAQPFTVNDLFMFAGVFGLTPADVNKVTRLVAKKEDYEQEYREKAEEIEEKRLKKLGGIK